MCQNMCIICLSGLSLQWRLKFIFLVLIPYKNFFYEKETRTKHFLKCYIFFIDENDRNLNVEKCFWSITILTD